MSKNLDEFFNDVSNEIVARKKRYVGKNFVNDDMKFSAAADQIRMIASNLLFRLERKVLDDKTGRSFGSFLRRLIEQF